MSDRPLSRRILRPAFRLLRGGRGAHFEETWPGLRLSRVDAGGEILWRGHGLNRLRPHGEVLPGLDRAVILGSGPSLADQRIEAFDAPALMLNGALCLLARLPRPAALVVEDERFVWRHLSMLRRDLPEDLPCFFSPSVIRAIASRDRGLLRDRPIGLVDDLRKPFDAPRRALEGSAEVVTTQGAAFSLRPDRGVVKCGTVAFSALQIAMGLGAKDICLAGIDLKNADAPRFYEERGQAAWSGIVKGQARILAHFALAGDVASGRGIRLTCASPVSALLDIGYPPDELTEGAA